MLATGLVPKKDAGEMSKLLGLSHTPDGFFEEARPEETIATSRAGVFLAGCCKGPKDIPDTIAQASGAASLSCAQLTKKGETKDLRCR